MEVSYRKTKNAMSQAMCFSYKLTKNGRSITIIFKTVLFRAQQILVGTLE